LKIATSRFYPRPLSLTFPSLARKSDRDNQRFFCAAAGSEAQNELRDG
jgi:hypothetical protein